MNLNLARPVIIQIAGLEYQGDTKLSSKKILSDMLNRNLINQYKNVTFIDLFDHNQNDKYYLHYLTEDIYKSNTISLEHLNRVALQITKYYMATLDNITKTKKSDIILIHGSVYDLALDLTCKYLLNFNTIFSTNISTHIIQGLLIDFMNIKTNPFLETLHPTYINLNCDLLVMYKKPNDVPFLKKEFTDPDKQDIYQSIVNIADKLPTQDTLCKVLSNEFMTNIMIQYNTSTSVSHERDRMYCRQILEKIESIVNRGIIKDIIDTI